LPDLNASLTKVFLTHGTPYKTADWLWKYRATENERMKGNGVVKRSRLREMMDENTFIG
jgi:hypothetical protein